MKKLFIIAMLLLFCSPGRADTVIMTQGFEGVFPPTGWTVEETNTHSWTYNWHQSTDEYVHSGNHSAAVYGSTFAVGGTQEEWLITNELTISGYKALTVTFWNMGNNQDGYPIGEDGEITLESGTYIDGLKVGYDWQTLWTFPDSGQEADVWRPVTIDLTDYLGLPFVLGWHEKYGGATHPTADNFWLDDITLRGIDCNVLLEEFESDFPPAGWSVEDNIGNGRIWDRNDLLGVVNATHGSGRSAAADSQATGGAMDTELHSPPIDLTDYDNALLMFESNFQDFAGNNDAWLDVSTDSGGSWSNLLHWTDDHGPSHEMVDLADVAGQTVILRFRYVDNGAAAFYWHLDDICIEGGSDSDDDDDDSADDDSTDDDATDDDSADDDSTDDDDDDDDSSDDDDSDDDSADDDDTDDDDRLDDDDSADGDNDGEKLPLGGEDEDDGGGGCCCGC